MRKEKAGEKEDYRHAHTHTREMCPEYRRMIIVEEFYPDDGGRILLLIIKLPMGKILWPVSNGLGEFSHIPPWMQYLSQQDLLFELFQQVHTLTLLLKVSHDCCGFIVRLGIIVLI